MQVKVIHYRDLTLPVSHHMASNASALVLCQDDGTQIALLGYEPDSKEDYLFSGELSWVPEVLNQYLQRSWMDAEGSTWGGVLEAFRGRGIKEVWLAPQDAGRLRWNKDPNVDLEIRHEALAANVVARYKDQMAILSSRAVPAGFISDGSRLYRLGLLQIWD